MTKERLIEIALSVVFSNGKNCDGDYSDCRECHFKGSCDEGDEKNRDECNRFLQVK